MRLNEITNTSLVENPILFAIINTYESRTYFSYSLRQYNLKISF